MLSFSFRCDQTHNNQSYESNHFVVLLKSNLDVQQTDLVILAIDISLVKQLLELNYSLIDVDTYIDLLNV
jgi:hypothetical protein